MDTVKCYYNENNSQSQHFIGQSLSITNGQIFQLLMQKNKETYSDSLVVIIYHMWYAITINNGLVTAVVVV